MSRIGKLPITIPAGVNVTLSEGRVVEVSGPQGTLSRVFPSEVTVHIHDAAIDIIPSNSIKAPSLWGLSRTLLANMIHGVTSGFEKNLEIVGVGYRVALRDNTLVFNLGYSHPVEFLAPEGIRFEIVENNKVKILGIDVAQVGQVAAKIRSFRSPEPYKGKGIRYAGEKVRRKAGKSAKAGNK